jgi:hypothetical protein
MLKLDGFDDCIVGVSDGIAMEQLTDEPLLVYDSGKIIEKLSLDMSQEEAIEYFEFNILRAYMGEDTPIFVREYNEEEEDDN